MKTELHAGSRGLTLIEVLAALVLLSLLAITCLPLLGQSMRTLRAAADPVAAIKPEVSRLADEIATDPLRFGIDGTLEHQSLIAPWPADYLRGEGGPEPGPVAVELLPVASLGDHQSDPSGTQSSQSHWHGRWLRISQSDPEGVGAPAYRWFAVPVTPHEEQAP